MRFNDCINCGEPIEALKLRCDECYEKQIDLLQEELKNERHKEEVK